MNYHSYGKARSAFIDFHIRHGKSLAKEGNTIEHIVPRSVFKASEQYKKMEADMNNFLLYPGRLNSVRSNHKYTSHVGMDGRAFSYQGLQDVKTYRDFDKFNVVSQSKGFRPDGTSRGRIARSIACFVTRYPELRDAIFDKVIDMASLLLWHHTNKISRFELELDDMIYKTQGRRNVYVRDPVKLVKDVAECQKKGKCIFERFDYDDHFDVV